MKFTLFKKWDILLFIIFSIMGPAMKVMYVVLGDSGRNDLILIFHRLTSKLSYDHIFNTMCCCCSSGFRVSRSFFMMVGDGPTKNSIKRAT